MRKNRRKPRPLCIRFLNMVLSSAMVRHSTTLCPSRYLVFPPCSAETVNVHRQQCLGFCLSSQFSSSRIPPPTNSQPPVFFPQSSSTHQPTPLNPHQTGLDTSSTDPSLTRCPTTTRPRVCDLCYVPSMLARLLTKQPELYALINNPALFKEHVNKEVAHIFQLQERIKNIIASNDPMGKPSLHPSHQVPLLTECARNGEPRHVANCSDYEAACASESLPHVGGQSLPEEAQGQALTGCGFNQEHTEPWELWGAWSIWD